MASFSERYPVAQLVPAAYNPRTIDAAGLDALERSIRLLGFVRPVLATDDGRLLAGHQRTEAARRMNLDVVPAILLDGVSDADERQFNQLHNGADLDAHAPRVWLPPGPEGWGLVEPRAIEGDLRGPGAHLRAVLCDLLCRFGPWGAAVATTAGKVIGSPHYALACLQMRQPLRVYRLPPTLEAEALAAFGRGYGVFSYGHLPRTPWAQTWAQMLRLRGNERAYESTLYERLVLPELHPGERLLDFGCGQGDYLRRLRAEGRHAWGIEFFPRSGPYLDPAQAHALIDEALAELTRGGGFDVVVADGVLNSIDRPEAEADVLACVAALCRPGGRVYLSGRRREAEARYLVSTTATDKRLARSRLKFFDAQGFTATWREGAWFAQRFHSADELAGLGGDRFTDRRLSRFNNNGWQMAARCVGPGPAADVEAALAREFDLAWPGGRSVGRAGAAIVAWRVSQGRTA